MSMLITKYKHVTFLLIAVALACQSAARKYLDPMLAAWLQGLGEFGTILLFLSTLSATYIFLIRIPLFIYEKWFWKVLHPGLDLGGVWRCTISYDTLALPYGCITAE